MGQATAAALTRLVHRDEARCLDLLGHLPTGAIDPTPRTSLSDADEGQMVTLTVRIEAHRAASGGRRAPYRILGRTAGQAVELSFFGKSSQHLAARFPEGAERIVHGQLGRFGGRWQIVHPDIIDPKHVGRGLLPLYPLVQGLGQARLRSVIGAILDRLPSLPEWLDTDLLRARGWPAWADALRAAHRPATPEALSPSAPARDRLAFDELLANQLALALMRRRRDRFAGRMLQGDGSLQRGLTATLPFALTRSQETARAEIARDMAAEAPMLRLLQGDVGSGKTVVALLAMLQAVEAGAQAALMAPTEVLARQHAATLGRLLAPLSREVDLLTGSEPAGRRRRTLSRLAEGAAGLVVGTHALFQEGVEFRDLGLVVIDEQHRFGVGQRLDLVVKGNAVDVLLMTATPIPRSLVLAAYGDVATSQLTEKPPGRKPIVTRAVPNERLEEVLAAIARALSRDERIYWICPIIDETPNDARVAAIERHRVLAERFGEAVGLVHGRLPSRDKEAALAAFARGETRILVATTVVEVGVDVPEASIMVIEHAERFGLAQLHQLRGRVGRGERPSSCLLLYDPPLGAIAHARLSILRETEDGFRIAEEDLRLRGPGEVLGLRQSGLPFFRFADLGEHAELLPLARDVAEGALARDPMLRTEQGTALRLLLYLFERQDAVRLLAAG